MIEIAQLRHAPGGNDIALVDAEPDLRAERQAQDRGAGDQQENEAVDVPVVSPRENAVDGRRCDQAEITFCSCTPSPSMPRRIVCPGLR